ncbi:protein jag [Bdellovibrio sp. HCB2-146]|uniref:Jag family protein n=1 Tax=Bdellovibrio sp. HCB2-146 TaxID=3394362 RepID=UPI0039BC758C
MGFLSKLFGGKGKSGNSEVEALVEKTLEGIIEKAQFDLDFKVRTEKEDDGSAVLSVELSGGDEEILKDKKGQMLDAFQLLLKRVIQHNFPEDKTSVTVDCGGYRDESENALIERAENLKQICIEQGKSVYYRALPPKDRKVVHQYLAKDARVKSRSLGDGLYKKIKIYPAKGGNQNANAQDSVQE